MQNKTHKIEIKETIASIVGNGDCEYGGIADMGKYGYKCVNDKQKRCKKCLNNE
jgi:hypothetical protein